MFYVRKSSGKYIVPSQTWAWAYENGAISCSDVVAKMPTAKEAHKLADSLNKGTSIPPAPLSPDMPTARPAKATHPEKIQPSGQPSNAPAIVAGRTGEPIGQFMGKKREFTTYVDPSYMHASPFAKSFIAKHAHAKKAYSSAYKSKEEVIRAALTELCDRYLFHAEFKKGQVIITTVAGEWMFLYNDRPIQLFHKSSDGNRKGAYHNQKMRFYSPVDALRYIYFHDRERVQRVMAGEEDDLLDSGKNPV